MSRGRQRLRRTRSGHVVDLFFLNGAVEVVDAKPQRRLRQLDAGRNPERFHVRDVVEHQARHGVHAQRVGSGRRRQLAHLVVVGMKRQRDEGLKSAGLVLQRAGAQHVIDALFVRLDVAVQHRDVRFHPEAMRDAMNRQPPIGVSLVVADLLAHPLGEDFGSSAGQRREPRVHQLAQHLFVGLSVEIGEERDLHRRKALQMDLGPDAFEAPKQLEVILERQVGMQAVDDVHFGERLIVAHAQLLPCVFERHRVGTGIAGPQPRKRTEQATRHADVRRFDANVVVVVGQVAVPPLALAIGQRRHLEQIGVLEQRARRPRASAARAARASRQCPAASSVDRISLDANPCSQSLKLQL